MSTKPATETRIEKKAAKRGLAALLKNQRGAMTFVELIVIFAVVIVVIAAAAKTFSDNTSTAYTNAGTAVQGLKTNLP